MRVKSTGKSRITKVRPGSGKFDAEDSLTFGVDILGIASKEGIARVGTSTGEGNAGGEIFCAFGMLSAINEVIASVGTGTSHSDTGFDFTFRVRFFSATKDRITLIGTFSGEDDTGGFLTLRVLGTIDEGGAGIFARTGGGDAFARCADKMGTVVTTAKNGIALILAIAGNRQTGIAFAFRMLAAADEGRAFIGTRSLRLGTLTGIAGKMCGAVTTAEDGIAVIGSLTRDGDAGALLTDRVLETGDK